MNAKFGKSGFLTRFYLGRDWRQILFWIIGLAGLMASAAAKFDGLYGTEKAMASISATLKTPAMVSLFGPFSSAGELNPAIIYAAEMMVFMGLFTAMMNIYFAVRNTRAEEDSGIAELISAHAIGKQSQLLAATLELIVINLLAGIIEALGLQTAGMTGSSLEGNWLFGLGLAAFGIMFGAFSLLVAQLVSSARSATMGSYLVLGILYVARMGTDVQNPDYTWFTIFGWIEKLSIYVDNNWLPLGLMLIAAVLTGSVSFAISNKRDVGAGVLPQRNGRQSASVFLAGPFSLVARLERTSIIVWLISLPLLGASYGSIFGTVGDILKTNPTMAKLIGSAAAAKAGQGIVLSFAATLCIVFALVATIPALITVLKINGDEKKGYLEQVHARGISRLRVFASYTGISLITGTIGLLLGIIGMAVAGNSTMSHPIDLPRYLRAFVGYWPALIVAVGITLMLVAFLPRLQQLAWIIPIYGMFSLYLGPLIDLPDWTKNISPYGWVNNVPVKAIDWGTAGWMTALGAALIVIAYLGYRHRDLTIN
ncbi:ABC transporter permease [Lacticaseibacillus hulanensis]|uniref:ABC transporter permease n=1 Tax=Lacticaseibacillus hulanensis TaxID=2493111 RepID=UPI000FD7E02B|nr:ABC transporter permease [Lacticaseibacillus hulanensis]